VQAQFISFTYQRNDKPSQKAANVCFFLGVSLNVIGATTSLMATSSLPSPTGLQEGLVAYQRAIEEAERISELMDAPDTSQLKVCVLVLTTGQLNSRDDEHPTSPLTIN
jgi:hypothetical protein